VVPGRSGARSTGSGSCGSGIAGIAPVGTATLGAGKWGHLDLTGELWQYTLDWDNYPYVDPCTDCAELTPGTRKQFRGGAYNGTMVYPFSHNSDNPGLRSGGIGFRCARTP
jgi:formylglycine-generating enzyme required for sulfatase activity